MSRVVPAAAASLIGGGNAVDAGPRKFPSHWVPLPQNTLAEAAKIACPVACRGLSCLASCRICFCFANSSLQSRLADPSSRFMSNTGVLFMSNTGVPHIERESFIQRKTAWKMTNQDSELDTSLRAKIAL